MAAIYPDLIHSPGFSNGTLCGTRGPADCAGVTCWECLTVLGRAKGPKKGDFVSVPYFNGMKNGSTTVYGIVEKAGRSTFTVRWESGIRNRIHYAEPKGVKRLPRTELDEVALRRLETVHP